MNSGITDCSLSLLALAWAVRRFRVAIPLTCLAVLIGIFVGWGIMIGFLIWLAGCGLVFLYSKVQVRSRSAALGMLCLFSILAGISLAVARNRQWDPLLSDLELGFVFALFLFALLQFQVRENSSPFSAVAHRFAGFSYSLYVLHFSSFLPFLAGSVGTLAANPNTPSRCHVRRRRKFAFCLACLTRYRGKNRCGTKVG